MKVYILLVAVIACAIDTVLYCRAAYPARTTRWFYLLPPFGGLVAYLRFGPNK